MRANYTPDEQYAASILDYVRAGGQDVPESEIIFALWLLGDLSI